MSEDSIVKHVVRSKPLLPVRFWRRILAALVGGSWVCRYCGLRYVPCHAENHSALSPGARNGWTCPDGHEGYIQYFNVFGGYEVRERFDNIRESMEWN